MVRDSQHCGLHLVCQFVRSTTQWFESQGKFDIHGQINWLDELGVILISAGIRRKYIDGTPITGVGSCSGVRKFLYIPKFLVE